MEQSESRKEKRGLGRSDYCSKQAAGRITHTPCEVGAERGEHLPQTSEVRIRELTGSDSVWRDGD